MLDVIHFHFGAASSHGGTLWLGFSKHLMRVNWGKNFYIKGHAMLLCNAIFFTSALTLHDVVDGLICDWNIVYFLVIFEIAGGINLSSSRMEMLRGLRPALLCIRIGDGGTITFSLGVCFSWPRQRWEGVFGVYSQRNGKGQGTNQWLCNLVYRC